MKEEVYGTTSINTGAFNTLKNWLETPLLWIACRHHMRELPVKKMTGQTKYPGVSLFSRLKSQWYTLEIVYSNPVKFDYSWKGLVKGT